jgi:ferric-dicitrate binding protein FerR (iron transport regulator)
MKHDPHTSDTPGTAGLERMHRHLLGDLEPEEFQQLENDLLASPEMRTRFLQAVRLEVALHEKAGTAGEETGRDMPSRNMLFSAAGIAAAIGLAALGVWWMLPRKTPVLASPAPAVSEIATLVDNRDCKWRDSREVTVEDRLSPGTMVLESGVALIEFDGGARLALQGPASLELLDPKTARLHRGSATVRCDEGRYSFSLLTPTSTVIDLGTEFGVAVEPDGASEVHVLDGEVEVADSVGKSQETTRFLNAGETLLLALDGVNRIVADSSKTWVRDYSSQADRAAKAAPPRVIARDVFPTESTRAKHFSLGTGWNGAWWRATQGKKGDFRFVPMEPMVKWDGTKGLAMLVGGWMEVRRFLETPIDPTEAQTLYLGFSLQRMNPVQRDKSGKLSEATVMFRSSKDPTTVLGMALSGRNHWVVLERGGYERSELPVTGPGPFYVVAKVEFDPRRGNRVSMTGFRDPASIPSQEPESWGLVTHRQLAKMTRPLDLIALQVRQSPFKFGEIILGNSWEAVVNPPQAQK